MLYTYRPKVLPDFSFVPHISHAVSGDKHVSFSLERGPAPEGPVPSTPLPACADTTVHWKYEAGNGHCRTEVGPDRESFTVLYKARECAKKGPLETILSWGWS